MGYAEVRVTMRSMNGLRAKIEVIITTKYLITKWRRVFRKKCQLFEPSGRRNMSKGLVFFRSLLKHFLVSDMIFQRIAQEYR